MSQTLASGLEGDLRDGGLARLLLRLLSDEATGIATVQGGQEIVAISVMQGELVSADALNRSLDEGISEVLVREGWVKPGDLSSLLDEQQVGGGRVIDLLIERGYLERPRFLEALRLHVYGLLVEVFRWQEGEFRFYAGDEVSYEDGIAPLSVYEVLVRASRELDERGPLPELFETHTAIERVTQGATPLPAPKSAGEGLLLELLVHPRNPGQLIRESGFSEYQTLFLLDSLRRAGLVQLVSSSADAELGLEEVEQALADTERVLELEAQQERLEAVHPSEYEELESKPGVDWEARWEAIPLIGILAGLWLLGCVLLVVGGGLSRLGPSTLLDPLQPALDESRGETRLREVARATRLFRLADGKLPESTAELESRRLMAAGTDPAKHGAKVSLEPRDSSFVVALDQDGEEPRTRTVLFAGDLMLDSSFAAGDAGLDGAPPLVLLD